MTVDCQRILVVPGYKFSPCGYEDVAKAYRTAIQNDAQKVYIISIKSTRDVLLFSDRFNIKYIFIPSKKILDFLYKQNKLPERIFEKNTDKIIDISSLTVSRIREKWKVFPQKIKSELTAIWADLFVRQRAKFFFVASFSLAVFALFSPLKPYYVTFSVFTLVLGIVCLTKSPSFP